MKKRGFYALFYAFSAFALASLPKNATTSIPTTISAIATNVTSLKNGTTTSTTPAKSLLRNVTEITTPASTSVFTAKTTNVLATRKDASKFVSQTTKSDKKTATAATKATLATLLTAKTTSKAVAIHKTTKPSTASTTITATNTAQPTTATPITTTQPTKTTVPNAPDALMFQNLLKVRQCSCDETEACALSAGSQISDCKKQCAHKMEYFGQDVDKLVSCFTKTEEELRAFDKCLSSNSNFCVSNNNTLVYIDTPNYTSFIGNQSLRAGEVDAVKGGVLVKKARKAFVHFRLIQKCVANCLKHQIVQCYGIARCAVPVPSAEELGEILDGCSQMKVHDHVHSACHCLVQKQQVRKLIGVCPLVLDRHLMRRL